MLETEEAGDRRCWGQDAGTEDAGEGGYWGRRMLRWRMLGIVSVNSDNVISKHFLDMRTSQGRHILTRENGQGLMRDNTGFEEMGTLIHTDCGRFGSP